MYRPAHRRLLLRRGLYYHILFYANTVLCKHYTYTYAHRPLESAGHAKVDALYPCTIGRETSYCARHPEREGEEGESESESEGGGVRPAAAGPASPQSLNTHTRGKLLKGRGKPLNDGPPWGPRAQPRRARRGRGDAPRRPAPLQPPFPRRPSPAEGR